LVVKLRLRNGDSGWLAIFSSLSGCAIDLSNFRALGFLLFNLFCNFRLSAAAEDIIEEDVLVL
jgi:hypothetical protein